MINKEMIGYAILIMLVLSGMAYFTLKGDTKTLHQKIMQTAQTVSTVRDMATTFSGISVHKDFTGINMASMKAKQLFQYDVVGTGNSSTIAMPFDDTILMAIAPTTNNKGYIITISLTASTDMDAVSKQTFEDKLNADFKSSTVAITGYTSSGADGTLSFQFAN